MATPRQWRSAKLPAELTHSTPAAAAASTARAAAPVPSKGGVKNELEWVATGMPWAATHAAACSNCARVR